MPQEIDLDLNLILSKLEKTNQLNRIGHPVVVH